MDPLTIITTALIAGAAAGGRDAASTAVGDAYAALRDRLTSGSDDSGTVAVIEANEAAPGGNVGELEHTVGRRGAVDDDELRSAAEAVLSRLPSDRVDDARSRVDLRNAQGVQVGNHGTQHNTFT